MMNFYVETKNENDTSTRQYAPSKNKLCEPLDLSCPKSVYAVKTPSSYSKTSLSLDNSPSYSHEKRDVNFSYFAKDVQRSPYMIQATELQPNLSQLIPSSVEDNSVPNDSVAYNRNSVRPFKAYRKKPICTSLSSSLNVVQPEEHFQQFRQEMLKENSRGGQLIKSNAKIRKNSHTPESTDSSSSGVRDVTYYQKRVKNNAASKLSRDRRRLKEGETAMRAMLLENVNLKLKVELAEARSEVVQLKIDLELAERQLMVIDCAAE